MSKFLLLPGLFLFWPLVRSADARISTRIVVLLGLMPIALVLQFYAGYHFAVSGVLFISGMAGIAWFVHDAYRTRATPLPLSEKPDHLLSDSLLLAILLFLPIAYLIFSVAGWWMFGWHNLLQLEVIYSILLNHAQDYGYSAHSLAYPYLGLLPVGVLSQVLDISPISIYVPLNFLALFIWTYSVNSFLNERRPNSRFGRIVATLLVFMLSGIMVYLVKKTLHLAGIDSFRIEPRATPVTSKFFYLDSMTWGIASLSMQYYMTVSRKYWSSPTRSLLPLAFAAQCVLIYPLLGPCAILIAAVPALDLDSRGHLTIRSGRLLQPVLLSLLLALVLMVYSSDKAPGSMASLVSTGELAFKALGGFVVVSVLLALAGFGLSGESMELRWRAWALTMIFFMAYLLLSMPMQIQYKYLYGTLVVLLFHAAAAALYSYDAVLQRVGGSVPYLAAIAGCCAMVLYFLQLNKHEPPLQQRFAVADHAWLMETRDSQAIKSALTKMHIPRNSLILLADAPQPLVPFLRVPQYFYAGPAQIGYAMSHETIVTTVKGYALSDYLERKSVGISILQECNLESLRQLAVKLAPSTLLLALAADSPCKPLFQGTSLLRHVATLDDRSEVFVQAQDMSASGASKQVDQNRSGHQSGLAEQL